jgi:hypothetical protein
MGAVAKKLATTVQVALERVPEEVIKARTSLGSSTVGVTSKVPAAGIERSKGVQPPQQAATPMGAFRAAEEAILAILGDEGAIPKRAALSISRQLSLISAEFALMSKEVSDLQQETTGTADTARVSYAATAKLAPAEQPKTGVPTLVNKAKVAKPAPVGKARALLKEDKDVVLVFHPDPPEGEGVKTSEENRKVLISEVVKGAAKISGVFAGKGGRVIVRVPDQSEAKKIRESGVSGFIEKPPRTVTPRIILTGVPREYGTEDKLLLELQNRNFPGRTAEEVKGEVKILAIRENRPSRNGEDDDTVSVVMTAVGAIQREILARSRLYFGYRSCKAKEEAATLGCFRCYGLDHRISECKMVGATCRRCSQTGHVSNDCRRTPHCKNCKAAGRKHDHGVAWADCPLRKAKVDRVRSRTQYA